MEGFSRHIFVQYFCAQFSQRRYSHVYEQADDPGINKAVKMTTVYGVV